MINFIEVSQLVMKAIDVYKVCSYLSSFDASFLTYILLFKKAQTFSKRSNLVKEHWTLKVLLNVQRYCLKQQWNVN